MTNIMKLIYVQLCISLKYAELQKENTKWQNKNSFRNTYLVILA